MKKTLLAMILAGGTLSMYAQTTPTAPTTPTTSPTTTPTSPTTSPSTRPTTDPTTSPTTQQGTTTGTPATTTTSDQNTNGTMNNGTTNSTTNGTMNNGTTNGTMNNGTMNNGTMNSTNNGTMNNGTMNNGTMNNGSANGNWNGVSSTPSTSWAPEGTTSYGWNSYGVWGSSANWNSNPNAQNRSTTGVNGSANMNGTGVNGNVSMNNDASMNSTGSYSAYAGTAIPSLPANVQTRFSQDFPAGANTSYSWNQYGDWFHTHQLNNGRLIQYFYDQRGSGYSLALPVLQTYVPENIVTSALQKYGSSLYSISMVRTNGGKETYQVGLMQRGQMQMQYLDESGASVSDVWRTEEIDSTMQSTQANAAMDGSTSTNSSMTTDTNSTQSSDANSTQSSGMNSTQSSGTNTQSGNGTNSTMQSKDAKSKSKTKSSNGQHYKP